MSAVVIVGAQWGDEGKGKIVDLYTESADVVVRFAGGPNAGHTLVVGDDKIVVRLGLIERHLAQHAYLLGAHFSAADAYAFTVIGWSKFVHLDLAPFPRIGEYLRRIAARPAVREAMRAQGMALAAAA